MNKNQIRLFRKLLRQFERMTAHQLKEDSCCQGVTLAQCHTLLEIEELGRATTAELSKRMGLDKSTLSRTIDGLVNISLVERIDHPSDRRFTLLSLTHQGQDVCCRINRSNDDYYGQVLKAIDAEKHKVVITHFETLVSALQNHQRGSKNSTTCESPIHKGK